MNANGSLLPPPLRGGAGVVFRNQFYLIGGEIAPGEFLENTWSYNDASNTWNQWVIFEPIIGASIYNLDDDYIYFFGGIWSPSTNLGYSDDLYVYDGYQQQWFSVVVKQTPPGRAYASMIHASSPYNRTIVFGGNNATAGFYDTWFMFDTGLFEEKTWYEVPKQYYPWPVQREGALMEYDPSIGSAILFGGSSASGAPLNDIWEFDMHDEVWNPVNATGNAMPPGRMTGSISITPKGYLIFGGIEGKNGTALNDMWLLTGV